MFQNALPQLLAVCGRKILKLPTPSRQDSRQTPSSLFLFKELETPSEYRLFFSSYRNRVLDLIRQSTHFTPLAALSQASTYVTLLTSTYGDPKAVTSRSDAAFMYWEGYSAYVEAVMLSVPEGEEEKNGQVRNVMMGMLERLLAFETTVRGN